MNFHYHNCLRWRSCVPSLAYRQRASSKASEHATAACWRQSPSVQRQQTLRTTTAGLRSHSRLKIHKYVKVADKIWKPKEKKKICESLTLHAA